MEPTEEAEAAEMKDKGPRSDHESRGLQAKNTTRKEVTDQYYASNLKEKIEVLDRVVRDG